MQIEILKSYKDLLLNKPISIGEKLEVTKERGEELIQLKIAKEIIDRSKTVSIDLTPPLKTPEQVKEILDSPTPLR